MAEKGAHLLLNGQNVFAEQLGGKGGDKGGLAGVEQGGEVLFADMAVVVPSVQAVEHGALDGVE